MRRLRAAVVAATALCALSACLGTGTRRVDAACREMRSTVVWELLKDNPTIRLVDLRSPMDVTASRGRLPQARQIPLEKLPARISELGSGPEATIVVFGRGGETGRRGCELLAQHGYKYVIFISDGAEGWFEHGLPTATPPPTPRAAESR